MTEFSCKESIGRGRFTKGKVGFISVLSQVLRSTIAAETLKILRRGRVRQRDFLNTKWCARVNQRHFGGKRWQPSSINYSRISTNGHLSLPRTQTSLFWWKCARKAVCTLPMVPCDSSPVTCFALASAMRKTKRLGRRLHLSKAANSLQRPLFLLLQTVYTLTLA